MKSIGIKYCGGCNPVIDRISLVQEIGKLLPSDHSIVNDESANQWDIGILVCGCPSACADRQELRRLARHWFLIAGRTIDQSIMPENELADAIVQKIKSLI
jgi:3-hydroxyacyl-[acyl-carrier-protein] dehydratase